MSLRSQGQLSDVACAIPRELFNLYKYHGNYAEDLTLGVKLIRDGHRVGMLSSIRVVHSHTRKAEYYLRRSFVDVIFLTSIFSDFEVPRDNNVIGSLFCAAALWKALKTIQPSRETTAIQALDEIIAHVRQIDPQIGNEALDSCEGFGSAPLQGWIEKFDRACLNKKNSLYKSAKSSIVQTRNMFMDRLSTLRSMLGVYPMVDETVAKELNEAVRKSLVMVIGSQLAFCCVNPPKEHDIHSTLIGELKLLLMTGV